MYRNTFVNVNLNNLKYNIESVIKNNNFKYYFGVVKASCYGHGLGCIETIINSGCNYLAVSSLDEAIEIRKNYDIPILCLGVIKEDLLDICYKNNITITIPSLEYIKRIKVSNLKVHIKIDTGMNRLGIKTQEELNEILNIIKEKNLYLEGIYTHLYNSTNKEVTINQLNIFEKFIKNIDAPIIHIGMSTGFNVQIPNKINGCRLGIIMYGFSEQLKLKSTFELVSEVIEIKKIKKDEVVSYNGTYKAKKDTLIAIVSIGYADGILRNYTGNYVYINNNKYKIIGNICMDMLMLEIDSKVNIYDKVYILKDNDHINEISNNVNSIPYEIMCSIGKRVPRIY